MTNIDTLVDKLSFNPEKQARLHITAIKRHVSPIELEDFSDCDEKDGEYPLHEIKTNHPEYYSSGGMEAIDFIDAHRLNFNLGNIIKYVTRAGKKEGEDRLTALSKARWYLEHEIERLEKEDTEKI